MDDARSNFAFSCTTFNGYNLSALRGRIFMVTPSHHFVIARCVKRRWVRHRSVHHPSSRVVFGANEVFDLASTRSAIILRVEAQRTHASAGTCPGANLASQYLSIVSIDLLDLS